MSHSKKLEDLLDLVEHLAAMTSDDPAVAPKAAVALELLFEHEHDRRHGRPAGRPDHGEEVEWAVGVKAYCVESRKRARERRADERTKEALRVADDLVEQAKRIADRPGKHTSDKKPLTSAAKAPDLKALYKDHASTDRTGADEALRVYFAGIDQQAKLIVAEIEKRGPLSKHERKLHKSLRKLAAKPDRYRQTEAGQKLELLREALNKLRT